MSVVKVTGNGMLSGARNLLENELGEKKQPKNLLGS